MRWYPRVAAIVAALCLLGQAMAVELDGPEQVEPGERFDVSVEGLTIPLTAFAKAAPPQMEWRVLCGEATIRPRLELRVDMVNGKPIWAASPYATVTASKPGAIAVVLFVVQDGVGYLASLEVRVGPFPDPDPDPPLARLGQAVGDSDRGNFRAAPTPGSGVVTGGLAVPTLLDRKRAPPTRLGPRSCPGGQCPLER